MAVEEHFRINTPDVVYEVIEGEAVIVNMSNGLYYSVDRSGAVIWDLIGDGTAFSTIVQPLTQRYQGSKEEIESAVAHFLDQLRQEQLIVAEPNAAASPQPNNAEDPTAYKPQFEAPVLQRYTDMEDLLLLDPIHNAESRDTAE